MADRKPGVYLCQGCGIGEALSVDELETVAGEMKAPLCRRHEAFCSDEGVETIRTDETGRTWRDELGIVMHDAGKHLETPGFRTRSYLSHPVSGWDDWPAMRDRFDPESPERYPRDWQSRARKHEDAGPLRQPKPQARAAGVGVL